MAKIYCMSDIHGFYEEFRKRIDQIKALSGENDKLILLGDYVDGGPDSFKVLELIRSLQQSCPKRVIVLMGNHEEWFLDFVGGKDQWGAPDTEDKTLFSFLSEEQFDNVIKLVLSDTSRNVYTYIRKCIRESHGDLIDWIRKLPLYYETEKQIFVHAGIDEEAGEHWKLGTSDYMFLNKYPAETGDFHKDIIAGHIGTAEISGNRDFHDIFWDGESHYYCDGTVFVSKKIPVLVYDEDTGKYYSLRDDGSLKTISKE